MRLTWTTGTLALMVGAGLIGRARDVRAADLPNARLDLVRSASASECKDEPHFAEELRARMTASQNAALERLVLQVSVDREEPAYVATIRVDGRKKGVRTLRADGPTCEPLHDALMVALLLLLDEDPTKPPAPAPPPPPTPAAPPPPPSPPPPSAAPDSAATGVPVPSPIPPLWLSAGTALTSGLPQGLSLAVSGEVAMRLERFDLGIGGFWAPGQTVTIRKLDDGTPLGDISLRLVGGRARSCYALLLVERVLRVSGCALGIVSALSGQGGNARNGAQVDGAGTVAWLLLGAGPDVHVGLTERIGLGISGSVLLATKRPSFFVDTTAPTNRYISDQVTAWGGLELRVRIW